MVESYPTFRLTIDEGLIESDTNREKLFGYCIESNKGPVLEPTFVASNEEAMRIFGVDFAPHFYQKPTGLVITRVKLPNMKKESKVFKATGGTYDETNTDVLMKVESVDYGTAPIKVSLNNTFNVNGKYNLTVSVDGIIARTYQGVPSIESVCKRINDKFAEYMKATFVRELEDSESLVLDGSQDKAAYLSGGSNGCLYKSKLTGTEKTLEDYLLKIGGDGTEANPGQYVSADTVDTAKKTISGKISSIDVDKIVATLPADKQAAAKTEIESAIRYTAMSVYKEAFKKMQEVDILGITTLSNLDVVRNELIDHVNYMNDPEVNRLRFGITAFLDYDDVTKREISDIVDPAIAINNEYMLYVGQGILFEEEGIRKQIPPHEAVQFYTGMRSALGYSEAIFGGEAKKKIIGAVDVLPLINDGEILVKEDIETLNEGGVMTFKKEYGDVTFLEGVTTTQESDVLSHESIMSIVLNVSKRLISISKVYQGQKLNEDLKASLTTALSNELKNITETDKSLISITEYNIPPYDVSVKSAAMVKFNDAGELIRESKVIIQCKIVPVGALRDIDLGIIVI